MTTPPERAEQLPGLRRQLTTTLSTADELAFLQMLWTVNALQTGRADVAGWFLDGYPAEAATEGIFGSHAVYPWELETLANEFLTTEMATFRISHCRSWNTVGSLVTQLRALENAEYGASRGKSNVLVEIGRIGARQFPWQKGYVGLPQLYRNAFIYGQGECAAYLEQASNLTSSDMTLVGFSLLATFDADPAIRPATDMALMHDWGVSPETLRRTLDRISRPVAEVRDSALTLRDIEAVTAYKPSVLRQFPCLRIGHRNRLLVAPLPELIMDRVTNGLFYDVVGGGGAVRDEIGKRFEAYSLALFTHLLPAVRFTPEATYRTRHGPIPTPDILMKDEEGSVLLAIECKASRMSVGARFGETPDADRGYEEIAKGVMQLWRFFAHCRQKVGPHRLTADAQGLVLTLDEWFAGRSTVIPLIVTRAHQLADSSAHEIPAADRRPVAFCTISEMETALATATPASLLETVRIGSGDKAGWIFSILHSETLAEKTAPKKYPFEDALGKLLPWYARLGEIQDQSGLE